MTTRIGILASGTGTNAQALLDASARGELAGGLVVVVIADRATAGALDRARRAGVEALFLDPALYSGGMDSGGTDSGGTDSGGTDSGGTDSGGAGRAGRAAYSEALAHELSAREVGLVCLAGFMRILSPGFIRAFGGRILNIHPALLPSFPGAHAVADALAWGVKVTGTTVHFATGEVDQGPILMQECVPVLPGDDEASLHARIKEVERRLYPDAVREMVSGAARVDGRVVHPSRPPASIRAL